MTKNADRAFALAGALLFATISTSRAENVSLVAQLLGSTVVPRNQSDAFGEAQFTYNSDTRQLDYFVNYDGVSPTKIDIHEPANPGETAAASMSFPLSASPVTGTATLTTKQASDLLAGKMYVDIHSQAYPNGEIRGQIQKQ